MGITLAEGAKILFVLSIYRVSKPEYYKSFHEYYNSKKLTNKDEDIERQLNSSLKYEYGGDWEYNEIIGYLEFYKIGNDIRCAYYKVIAKKIVRTRTKKFKIVQDTLSKITVSKSFSNEKLISEISELVNTCVSKKEFNRRFIQREIFDNMIDCINWKKYLFE